MKKISFVLCFAFCALAAASAQTYPKYKIGDRGPSGGWVFYDKGYYTDGWRYMEAAPLEAEFKAVWGPEVGVHVGANETIIGSGARNTARLAAASQRDPNVAKAAWTCSMMNVYGFTGWFLPSRDELDLMYRNLALAGYGDFHRVNYWSSTEDGVWSAWQLDFFHHIEFTANKTRELYVRAARTF